MHTRHLLAPHLLTSLTGRLVAGLAGAALALGVLTPVTASSAAEPGSISGVVTDDAAAPLAGIEVAVIDSAPYGDVVVATATTDAVGAYTVGGIIPDPYYKVRFTDPTGDHATEYYHDEITGVFADWVAVTEGGNNTSINASLEPGSSISGRLTIGAGTPVSGGTVTLWWMYGARAYATVGTWQTDADGHWTIPAVRGASYALTFRDPATGASETWKEQADITTATTLVVPSGEDVTGIDVLLGGVVRNTAAPTIGGTAQVGKVLTASAGAWQPSDTSVAFRWVVGDDTSPSDDPTGTTYVPTAQDVGRTIRVEATGTRGAGWIPATAWSASTAPVVAASAPTLVNERRPRIKGVLRVGQTVRVTSGDWTPWPKNLTFRWFAAGRSIRGAVHRRLTLKPGLVGKRLVVRVTASAPGYTSLTVRTRASDRVRR